MVSLNAGLQGSPLSPAQQDVLHGSVSGDTDELRSGLLAGGVPDIVVPGFGYTPLTAAVASRCGEAVQVLLAAGARPALAPPGRQSPLLVAVLVGDAQAVAALVEAGADPNAAGPGGTARSVADVLADPLVLATLGRRSEHRAGSGGSDG